MAGRVPHPSVMVVAMPQSLGFSLQVGSSVDSLSGSVVVGNSQVRLRPVKVQPSLVSTMAVVDILQVLRCQLLGIFPVELEDEVGRVFEIAGWVPGTIGVMETIPLESVLDLVSMALEVEDLHYFPLLLFLDDDRGRQWL